MIFIFILLFVLSATYLGLLCKNDWTELCIPAKILACIGGIFLLIGILFFSEFISLEPILLQKGSIVLMVAGIILMILSLMIDVSGDIQEGGTKSDQAVNRFKRRGLLIRGAAILGIIIFMTVTGVLFFY